MATFDPGHLPPMPADPELAFELGFAREMDDSFALRWDKRAHAEHVDYGFIGEDDDGIWMTLHPDSALLRYPELWDVVMEFRSGFRELTERDLHEKSSFEFTAKEVMSAAYRRSLMKKDKDDG